MSNVELFGILALTSKPLAIGVILPRNSQPKVCSEIFYTRAHGSAVLLTIRSGYSSDAFQGPVNRSGSSPLVGQY
jgi:hypothetical protein